MNDMQTAVPCAPPVRGSGEGGLVRRQPPPRNNFDWDNEATRVLKREWKRGTLTKVIAQKLGCEWWDVARRSKKLRLPPRRGAARTSGLSVYVSPAIEARIRARAASEGRPVTAVVNEVLHREFGP